MKPKLLLYYSYSHDGKQWTEQKEALMIDKRELKLLARGEFDMKNRYPILVKLRDPGSTCKLCLTVIADGPVTMHFNTRDKIADCHQTKQGVEGHIDINYSRNTACFLPILINDIRYYAPSFFSFQNQ